MYAIVPAVNGVPDVGYTRVVSAYSVDGSTAYANIETDTLDPEWVKITDNSIIAALTPNQAPTDTQTPEERIAKLEAENADLKATLDDMILNSPIPAMQAAIDELILTGGGL